MTDQKTVLFSHSQIVYIMGVRDMYKKFVKKDDICFDLGSCWGNMTYPLMLLDAKVVAVEPNHKSCEKMDATFRTLTNMRYIIENVAVSNKEGVETFFINPYAEISTLNKEWIDTVTKSKRFGENNKEWVADRDVQTTTLSSLIKKHGKPHFIKIDVEGHESKVLESLDVPVDAISFEYQIENMNNALECMKKLDSLGDYVYTYTNGSEMKFVSDEWFNKSSVMSRIIENSHSHEHCWGDIYAFLRSMPLEDISRD